MRLGFIGLAVLSASLLSSCGGTRHATNVVGRGRTAVGREYVATAGPEGVIAPLLKLARGCPIFVSIQESEVYGTAVDCFKRSDNPDASITCTRGRLTVRSHTLAVTRYARLVLADGRKIVSRVIVVPARLGGPTGVYYQVLSGSSSVPSQLEELGERGRVTRKIPLPHVENC
jgi:hypothetical protein